MPRTHSLNPYFGPLSAVTPPEGCGDPREWGVFGGVLTPALAVRETDTLCRAFGVSADGGKVYDYIRCCVGGGVRANPVRGAVTRTRAWDAAVGRISNASCSLIPQAKAVRASWARLGTADARPIHARLIVCARATRPAADATVKSACDLTCSKFRTTAAIRTTRCIADTLPIEAACSFAAEETGASSYSASIVVIDVTRPTGAASCRTNIRRAVALLIDANLVSDRAVDA